MNKIELKYPEVEKLNNLSALGVVIFVAIICLILGRISVAVPMIAIPIGLVILVLIFSKAEGIVLDIQNQKYQKFKQNIFGRKGDWKNLQSFTDVVVLNKKGNKIQQSLTGDNHMSGTFKEVYLMEPNHRRRLFICSSEDSKFIAQQVRELMDLGFNYLKYNPERISRR
ncbi:MAG: hypothetical protein R2799_16235 [Crocinitomicaceae bacterium]